jgi:hypothetical protein
VIRALPLLLLCACATPRGPWTVTGADWPVQQWADAAIHLTGDRSGHLQAGGRVIVAPDITAMCGFPAYGCGGPRLIYVQDVQPVERSALAHEFCHLGLQHGGGWGGPVVLATEPQADACALLVRQEILNRTVDEGVFR